MIGVPNGLGRWINTVLNNIYEGEFKDGYFDGIGRYIWQAEVVDNVSWVPQYYEGLWKDGLRHGFGIQQEMNGDVTKGIWKRGNIIDKH